MEVLRGLASAYRQQGSAPREPSSSFMDEGPQVAYDPMADAARALKKALSIVEEREPPDHLTRAEILLELGDLYNAYDKINKARDQYVEAWTTLSLDEELEEQRYTYFDKPRVVIRNEPPKTYGLSAVDLQEAEADALGDGFVLARFRVDTRGRVKDIEILESNPEGVMDRRMVLALRQTYYQPRFSEGEPVDTEDMLRRHEFRFPSDLVKPEPDKDAEESDAPDPDDRGRLENPAASVVSPD